MAAKKSPAVKKSKAVSKPAPAVVKAPAAVKKPTAAKVAPVKAVPLKPAAKSLSAKPKISPEERWKLVAEAAYYLAEKRHFAAGHSEADWLTAERQVDAKLKS